MNKDAMIADRYKMYQDNLNSRWEFGNRILYNMCKNNPKHDNEDVIVGKLWLIGRSYAAAIERRKMDNTEYDNESFYYDVIAPIMMQIGGDLDERLKRLRRSKESIERDLEDILKTHNLLVEAFEVTGMKKRSLASKYLHFHCPEKFFIYDSRVNREIKRLVKRPDKSIPSSLKYDAEYGVFVCRMLELQESLGERELSPRDLDTFLLWSSSH